MIARPPLAAPTGIDVSIDEIVLRGVPAEHGPAVVEAFRQRLDELLSSADLDALHAIGDRVEASRRLEPIGVAGSDPVGLGRSVAESVWAAVAPVAPVAPVERSGR